MREFDVVQYLSNVNREESLNLGDCLVHKIARALNRTSDFLLNIFKARPHIFRKAVEAEYIHDVRNDLPDIFNRLREDLREAIKNCLAYWQRQAYPVSLGKEIPD